MIDEVRRLLEEKGIENALREALWLMEAADTDQAALEMGRRRARGEPLQYITGVAGFRHLDLSVGPGVFIPRPETEMLVQHALDLLPPGGVVVDAGTGSGAVALSIVHERSDARVFATESSPAALGWATHNRDRLGLKVELIDGDLLDGLPPELARAVDVVVSNPPYVAADEARTLPTEVVQHEPHEALFAGPDGLAVIRRLAAEACTWLRPSGWLVCEIGETQGATARDVVVSVGYDSVRCEPDLAGRDRVMIARRP